MYLSSPPKSRVRGISLGGCWHPPIDHLGQEDRQGPSNRFHLGPGLHFPRWLPVNGVDCDAEVLYQGVGVRPH